MCIRDSDEFGNMIGGDKEDQQAAKRSNEKQDASANDMNFDEWQGSTMGMFDDAVYEEDDREEVDEESGMTSTYSSITDRTRTERWGIEETRRFYKGLQQCGTDFTLMLAQFPGRFRLRHCLSQPPPGAPPLEKVQVPTVGCPLLPDSSGAWPLRPLSRAR